MRLNPPANAKIIYANERGRIKEMLESYPMGTFVEIQCENGTVLKGESFLTCIDNGGWDLPMTECVLPPSTTPKTTEQTTESTTIPFGTISTPSNVTTSSNSTPSMTSRVNEEIPTKEFLIDILLDKDFWTHLKHLYFYGCNNQETLSKFCNDLMHPEYYTDLTSFELPESNEYRHMDVNLLTHLKAADEILFVYDSDVKLDIEHLLPFILRGNVLENISQPRMTKTTENAYRLVLCLYIDTILLDKSPTIKETVPSDEENITKKLKFYLVRVTSKAYTQYLTTAKSQSEMETTTASVSVSSNSSDLTNRNSRSTLIEQTTPSNEDIQFEEVTSQTSLAPATDSDDSSDAEAIISIDSEKDPIEMSNTTTEKNSPKHTNKSIDSLEIGAALKDSEVERELTEDVCKLEALPNFPPNSLVSAVKVENETIFKNPDRLYLIGPVTVTTRVYFVCKEGFKSATDAPFYFECSEKLNWIGNAIKCEGKISILIKQKKKFY